MRDDEGTARSDRRRGRFVVPGAVAVKGEAPRPARRLVLGLESSGRLGGAAVAELRPGADAALRAEHLAGVEATHSERLMPAVERAMEAAGATRGEVAAVAVTTGPGSYTGIRIGVMTAKALAFGWGLPLVPILTLEALAWQAGTLDGWIVPVLPARRGAYFGALYRADPQADPAGWEQRVPPGRWTPEELLRPLAEPGAGGPFCVVGEGAADLHRWLKTPAGAALAARAVTEHWTLGHLRPGAVAMLGAARLAAGRAADPMEVEPVYLRETEAERRAANLEGRDGGKSSGVGGLGG